MNFKSNTMVSVIIPVFNAEQTIVSTLESVKSQTYTNYEIIVVDDGSTDLTKSKVQLFMEANPSIRILLISKHNGGVSSARNRGMELAKGDLIALLDADDEWLPEKLKVQVRLMMEHPDIDFVGCNRNSEHFDRFFFVKFGRLNRVSARLLLFKNFFPTPTVLFKKTILDSIGFFDETQCYAEDGNYWLRIANAFECYLLNESLVITGGRKPNIGFSGLSSNLAAMHKGEIKNLKDAKRMQIIGDIEYQLLFLYTKAKYYRRFINTKLKKNKVQLK